MTVLQWEIAAYVVYFLVGPGTWILFGIAMYQSRKRMRLIHDLDAQPAGGSPRVTILIPAKDEERTIRGCIERALAQHYSNFSVLAIDDRSTDGTGRILDEMAAADGRLRVLHIPPGPLPEGWMGKTHALHRGVEASDGQWLLFVDADVTLTPRALPAALAAAVERELGMISLLPRMQNETVWEKTMVPLLASAVTGVFAAALANNGQLPNAAFANGQFMLARRDAYEKSGGWEAVRDQATEDIALARIFKRSGLRPRISWGADLATVRMYDSWGKMIRGFTRMFYGASVGSWRRSAVGILFVLVCCYSAVPALALGIYRNHHPISELAGWGWIITAAVHWALLTAQVGLMYRWTENAARYALLFPVSGLVVIWVLMRTIWTCAFKTLEWRGTTYSHTMRQATGPTTPLPPTTRY